MFGWEFVDNKREKRKKRDEGLTSDDERNQKCILHSIYHPIN
jgi:hypothetical protein